MVPLLTLVFWEWATWGARCQKFVPAGAIKWMLAGIIVLTAGEYVAGFFY